MSSTIVLFTGDYNAFSATARAVPGFASRSAAEASAVTALYRVWGRPDGSPGRGTLSEEGTAIHKYDSR
jgi:hypothetical protein